MPVLPATATPWGILRRLSRGVLEQARRGVRRVPPLNQLSSRLRWPVPPSAPEQLPPKSPPHRDLNSQVRGIRPGRPHRLEVTGWAFRRHSAGDDPKAITLVALGPIGTTDVRFPALLRPDEEVNRSDADRNHDRSSACFVAQIDLAALVSAGPAGDYRWRIEVQIEDRAGVRQEPFGAVAQFGNAGMVPVLSVGPSPSRLIGAEVGEDGLVLTVQQPDAWARTVDLTADRLRVRIGHSARFWPTRAALVRRPEARTRSVPQPGPSDRLPLRLPLVRGVLDVDLSRLGAPGGVVDGRWTIEFGDLAGRSRMLRWALPSVGSADGPAGGSPMSTADLELAGDGLRVLSSPNGLFRLDVGAEAVLVSDAQLLTGPDRLRLTVGGLAADLDPISDLAGRFWLESIQQRVPATGVSSGTDGVRVEFTLQGKVPFGTEMRPLISDRYVFRLGLELAARTAGRTSESSKSRLVSTASVSASIGSRLAPRLGERTELDRLSVRIERSGQGEFAVRITAPRPVGQAGRIRMLELAMACQPGSAPPGGSVGGGPSDARAFSEPLAPAALFDCFDGRSSGDNPGPIHHELLRRRPNLRAYWVVADHSVPVPDGAVPVIVHSQAHFEARARAQFVVTNCWLNAQFRAGPDQRVLQTWHGTPLKRMGLDRIGVNKSEAHRSGLITQTGQWTWLISQNPYSTEIFTRAYRLNEAGVRLAEIGYPRNDVLRLGPDDQRLERIQGRLGLAPGERAVLFAPTWRENGRAATTGLDFRRLRARLGPDWRILVRGHANTVRSGVAVRADGVIDVTRYPDITDLFAVAEVMITDYSSAMFDFSITGKPLIFFVPDLSNYAETLRGTYFDLGELAPGPLVTSTSAVADEIERAVDGVPLEYAERYRTWTAKFNPFDDGHATQRAVDLLLGDLD